MRIKLRNSLRIEALEDRQVLSAVSPLSALDPPPPVGAQTIVAPPVAAFAPILLPGSVTPPKDTTVVPPPLGGGLPDSIPPIAALAEQTAVNGLADFGASHPGGISHVFEVTRQAGHYILYVSMSDGLNSAAYIVNESTDGSIVVTFNMNDIAGGLSESLYAKQYDPNNGGMFTLDTLNGNLQNWTLVNVTNGHTTSYAYAPIIAT